MEHSKDFPDAFYRVTIKGLIIQDDKLMMIRESEALSGGKWELPGGGLDFGEDIHLGFSREIEEEMGLVLTRMATKPTYLWTHRFEHQRDMDWYYSLVLAYRIELKDLNFTPSEECEEIGFFSKDEMESMQLGGQMTELPRIFNPADFKDNF